MTKTVLIVDDSISIRMLLKYALDKAMIFNTFDCADAWQALNTANNLEVIDFVVCDIYMPGLDGFDFIKKLKQVERYRNTPVLLMSVNNADYNTNMAKQVGAVGLMKKPIDPFKLISVIREITTRGDHHLPSQVSLW